MKKAISIWLILTLIAPGGTRASENTEKEIKYQDLRLYRVNKDGIESRFWFTRGKGKKAGCHNIRKRSRLFRAVQYGYYNCSVYAKKDCLAGSEIKFTRKDDDKAMTELQQGYSWFAVSEHDRGPRIKSWSCQHQP